MVKYKGRDKSTNIEDRRTSDDELANVIIGSMKAVKERKPSIWDDLMSPTPISPTSMKFEKKMGTKDKYSYSPLGKK